MGDRFEAVVIKAPSLIFVDDIHLICPDKQSEIRDGVLAVPTDQ